MRRPRSGQLWAGSGNGTLVEHREGVPGAAEAMPPGRKPQEQLPVAKLASSRWWAHLGNWQRNEVARHAKQSSVELFLLGQFLLLLAPESHLLEDKGFGFLMFTEPFGHARHIR